MGLDTMTLIFQVIQFPEVGFLGRQSPVTMAMLPCHRTGETLGFLYGLRSHQRNMGTLEPLGQSTAPCHAASFLRSRKESLGIAKTQQAAPLDKPVGIPFGSQEITDLVPVLLPP